jgi:hypothetical protein
VNIERQVCSLPLARKLKALGVTQATQYQWFLVQGPDEYQVMQVWEAAELVKRMDMLAGIEGENFPRIATVLECAAYTCAELGELLPPPSFSQRVVTSGASDWRAYGWKIASMGEGFTEADARAALLVSLIESGGLAADSLADALKDPAGEVEA